MTCDRMKDLIGAEYPRAMPRRIDEAMDRMVSERSQTGFHPCGTNRMGNGVVQSVVGGKLGVSGVKGLWFVDASVFPAIPESSIQNTVYMMGEKGADTIKSVYAELYGKAA